MKVAIVQPYIFPYIGYFQLIVAVDKFIFYDDVNFKKKSWINRNKILINGQANLFSIPLKKASQNKLINEIELRIDSIWVENFIKTLEFNYKKAPYFKDIFPLIENILEKKTKTISDLAIISIKEVSNYMGLKTKFELSSEKYSDSIDFNKEARLIEICKKTNAIKYINPIGGKEIYTKDDFMNHGLKLEFIEPQINEYKQFNSDFIKNLSVIDLLMFNSKKHIKNMLNDYKLI